MKTIAAKTKTKLFEDLLRFGQICIYALDSLFLFFIKRHVPVNSNGIIVLRLDAVGDFILWLDAAKDLRKIYAADKYSITLLGNHLWTSLAEKLPYFDAVWSLDKRKFITNPLYRLKVLKKVRKAGFQILLQPVFSRNFVYDDAIVRASAARDRIGYDTDGMNISAMQKKISNRWYTRLIPGSKKQLMELERNADFLRSLGYKEFRATVPRLSLDLNAPKEFKLREYYVISPAASVDLKRWPIANFVGVASHLYKATGWTAVVCGNRHEKKLGEILERKAQVPIQNWMGKTSLTELAAIIAHSKILIGNDSAAVHIAAAVSTPAVCIVGGGHFGRFLPYRLEVQSKNIPSPVYHEMDCYGCGWKCKYPIKANNPTPCIQNVYLEQVWDAVRSLLDRRQEPPKVMKQHISG